MDFDKEKSVDRFNSADSEVTTVQADEKTYVSINSDMVSLDNITQGLESMSTLKLSLPTSPSALLHNPVDNDLNLFSEKRRASFKMSSQNSLLSQLADDSNDNEQQHQDSRQGSSLSTTQKGVQWAVKAFKKKIKTDEGSSVEDGGRSPENDDLKMRRKSWLTTRLGGTQSSNLSSMRLSKASASSSVPLPLMKRDVRAERKTELRKTKSFADDGMNLAADSDLENNESELGTYSDTSPKLDNLTNHTSQDGNNNSNHCNSSISIKAQLKHMGGLDRRYETFVNSFINTIESYDLERSKIQRIIMYLAVFLADSQENQGIFGRLQAWRVPAIIGERLASETVEILSEIAQCMKSWISYMLTATFYITVKKYLQAQNTIDDWIEAIKNGETVNTYVGEEFDAHLARYWFDTKDGKDWKDICLSLANDRFERCRVSWAEAHHLQKSEQYPEALKLFNELLDNLDKMEAEHAHVDHELNMIYDFKADIWTEIGLIYEIQNDPKIDIAFLSSLRYFLLIENLIKNNNEPIRSIEKRINTKQLKIEQDEGQIINIKAVTNFLKLATYCKNIGNIIPTTKQYENNDKGSLALSNLYSRHVITILTIYFNPPHVITSNMYINIGNVLIQRNQKSEGFLHIETAQKMKKQGSTFLYGLKSIETATSCFNLGIVYQDQSLYNYKEALNLLKNTLEILRKGKKNQNDEGLLRQAHIMDTICWINGVLGNIEDGIKMGKEAVDVYTRQKRNVEACTTYRQIANLYRLMKKYKLAVQYFEKSLNAMKMVGGVMHDIDIANMRQEWGSVHFEIKEYQKAFKCYDEAKRTNILVHGETDPAIAKILISITMIHQSDGKYDRAIECLNEAEKILENDEEQLIIIYNLQASLKDIIGKYDEALLLYRKAIELGYKVRAEMDAAERGEKIKKGNENEEKEEKTKLSRRVQGSIVRVEKMIAVENMGNSGHGELITCNEQAYIDDASTSMELFNSAIQQRVKNMHGLVKKMGKEHPTVADAQKELAMIIQDKGDLLYKKALDEFILALDTRREFYGSDHQDTKDVSEYVMKIEKIIHAGVLCTLRPELLLRQTGLSDWRHRYETARMILNTRLKQLGDMALATAMSIKEIGGLYEEAKDHVEALKQYEKELKIRNKVGTVGLKKQEERDFANIQLALAYRSVGRMQDERREFKNSLDCYTKSYEILEKVNGDDAYPMAEASSLLAWINSRMKNYDTSQEFYNRAIMIIKKTKGDNSSEQGVFYKKLGQMQIEQGKIRMGEQNYMKALKYLNVQTEDVDKKKKKCTIQ